MRCVRPSGSRIAAGVFAVVAGWASAVSAAPTYVKDIKPLFREHCFSCHNPDDQKGDLDLTTYAALRAGSGTGPIVDTEDNEPDYSTLYLVMTHEEEPTMPPDKDPLAAPKLSMVKRWIEAGAPEATRITFDDDVKPIFREHCFECHGASGPKADLNLTRYGSVMTGSSSGAVISPGSPGSSKLYMAVSHQAKPFMPKGAGKIPAQQIRTIREWIAGGVLEDENSEPQGLDKAGADIALSMPKEGEKPEPTLPGTLLMEPPVHTQRAGQLTALAHSPWAPLAAVGGQHQILLYHTGTLELLGILPFPEGFAESLRFSRNGKYLLAGGGYAAKRGMAVLFNVETGERVASVGDEFDIVLTADINAQQTRIAIGGPNQLVKVFDTATGELAYKIEKHTEWVTALSFSPDGVLLASGDRNGGLHVWEGPSGRSFYDLDGHDAAVTALAWRPDSNALASAGEDGRIKLWNMQNGKQLKSWRAHGAGVLDVAFTHDGRIVSAGRDKRVIVWDVNGKKLKTLGPFPDLALAATFNQDGSRVIAGDWTGQVRVWETKSGSKLGELSTNPPTLATRIKDAKKTLAGRTAAREKLPAMKAAKKTATQAGKKLEAVEKREKELERAVEVGPADVKAAKSELKKAEAARAEAREAMEDAGEKADRLADAADEADRAMEEARAAYASAKEKLKTDQEAVAAAEDEKEKKKAKAALAEAEKNKLHLADARDEAERALASAQSAVEQARSRAGEAEREIERKAQAKDDAADRLAAAEEDLKSARGEWTELKKSLPETRKKAKASKQRVAEIQRARDKIEASRQRLDELKTAGVYASLYKKRRERQSLEAERENALDKVNAAREAAEKMAEKLATAKRTAEKAPDKTRERRDSFVSAKEAVAKARKQLAAAEARLPERRTTAQARKEAYQETRKRAKRKAAALKQAENAAKAARQAVEQTREQAGGEKTEDASAEQADDAKAHEAKKEADRKADVKAAHESAVRKVETRTAEHESLTEAAAELQSAADAAEAERADAAERVAEKKQALRDAAHRLDEADRALNAAVVEAAAAPEQARLAEAALRRAEAEVKKAKAAANALSRGIADAREAAGELDQRYQNMRAEK